MKFHDLNFDCLETVLEYLGLIDLLNVADSTKRLRKAAELVFSRKFGEKVVIFDAMKISPDKPFTVTKNCIKIKCLKTSLQLLRCVGCAVSRIDIYPREVGQNYTEDRKIFTYINNYCAEYLKKIYIQRKQVGANQTECGLLDYFDKPFTKLVYITIIDYNSTEKSRLERIFPNLRELYLYGPKNGSFHTNHFAYLQKLEICEFYGSPLQNEMVTAFLHLNPQLKQLDLRSNNLNMNLIRSVVESLQNIETLSLFIRPMTTIRDSENFIHMKSVKQFHIRFRPLDELHAYLLPFSFEQLDEFSISSPEAEIHSAIIQQFYNFIDKHSTITNLSIRNIGSFGAVNWSRLAKTLPLLVAIVLKGCQFSTDEAIEIMAKFQMLKQFEFFLRDEYDHFRKRLNNKWEAKYLPLVSFVTLKRRI